MEKTHVGDYSDENMEKLINVTDVNDIHIDEKLNEIRRIDYDGNEISIKVMDIIDEIELIKKFLVNGLIKKDEFLIHHSRNSIKDLEENISEIEEFLFRKK